MTFLPWVLDRMRLISKRPRSELELLCTDGTRAPVDDFAECNWGQVKSSMVMVRREMSRQTKHRIINLLQNG